MSACSAGGQGQCTVSYLCCFFCLTLFHCPSADLPWAAIAAQKYLLCTGAPPTSQPCSLLNSSLSSSCPFMAFLFFLKYLFPRGATILAAGSGPGLQWHSWIQLEPSASYTKQPWPLLTPGIKTLPLTSKTAEWGFQVPACMGFMRIVMLAVS